MKPITATRSIRAPAAKVFQTVADVRNFSKAVPHVIGIEFLTEQQSGVGTRFRETRLMDGREVHTELEVTEFVENERARLVSDAGGTIWDTVFTIKPDDGCVELQLVMDIRPYRLPARLFIPLIRGKVVKGVERDMDCIREFCERDDAP